MKTKWESLKKVLKMLSSTSDESFNKGIQSAITAMEELDNICDTQSVSLNGKGFKCE